MRAGLDAPARPARGAVVHWGAMTFRDDGEALRARAEALEREVERLRRERDALRGRSRADVEQLAERLKQATAAATPRPTTRFAHLLDESLSPTWSRVVWSIAIAALLPAFFAVVIALDPVLAWFGTSPEELGWAVIAIVVGWLVISLLAAYVLRLWVIRLEARHERRQLAALPFPLALEGYLAVLASPQPRKSLVVTVAFVDEPADRRTLEDAVRGATRQLEAVHWRDGRLEIVSAPIDTLFPGHRGPDWHDNLGLHRWFRQLARDALIPIARAYPIRTVRVS